jgi:hypothetical protein
LRLSESQGRPAWYGKPCPVEWAKIDGLFTIMAANETLPIIHSTLRRKRRSVAITEA